MAEEAPTTTTEPDAETQPETVSADRFREVAKHKKAAEDRAKALEADLADLRSQIEQRESQGLPELDRLQKQLERAETRAQEAEKRAQETETLALNLRKEGWVTAKARELGFVDPEDALNPRYVKLEEIESAEDAERVLKRVAKAKQHLIKPKEPERPEIGRVLSNGKADNGQPASSGPVDVNDPNFKRQMGEEMLQVLRGAS